MQHCPEHSGLEVGIKNANILLNDMKKKLDRLPTWATLLFLGLGILIGVLGNMAVNGGSPR